MAYWSAAASVIAYQQAHHQAIILGRVDSPFLDRLFIFAASSGIGIHTGAQGGTATGVEIGMISCDSVVACVKIEGRGSDASIGEMRQFGQSGVSDAVPYPGAAALLIEGSGLFRIAILSAHLIDAAPIVARNTSACSTVLVSQMDVDFSYSRRRTVNILDAERCSPTGSPATRALFGLPPVIGLSVGQSVVNGAGGEVSWPEQVSR